MDKAYNVSRTHPCRYCKMNSYTLIQIGQTLEELNLPYNGSSDLFDIGNSFNNYYKACRHPERGGSMRESEYYESGVFLLAELVQCSKSMNSYSNKATELLCELANNYIIAKILITYFKYY
jgi:hypothetical protein